MVTPRQKQKQIPPNLGHLPLPGGDAGGTKWLIAAVLAAGKDDCTCDSCQLLKRFGGALSTAMLKEEPESGD